MNIVDNTIVDKLITFNMTSENVIIKEFETMNTFQEEHIERLEKKKKNVHIYNKLEEIKEISIEI